MASNPLEHSAFDSEIFGIRFLRVTDPDPQRVADALRSEQGPLIVDLKLDAADQKLAADFASVGFRKAAVMVSLSQPVSPEQTDLKVQTALTLSDQDLLAHAEGFMFQRFRQDPRIDRKSVIHLMTTWISNSLAGRRKTVAIGRNFCTYSIAEDTLTIDLLSVLDTGRGIGLQLLMAIQMAAKAATASTLHVTTEAENSRALGLYVRAGYVPVSSSLALHWVRPNG